MLGPAGSRGSAGAGANTVCTAVATAVMVPANSVTNSSKVLSERTRVAPHPLQAAICHCHTAPPFYKMVSAKVNVSNTEAHMGRLTVISRIKLPERVRRPPSQVSRRKFALGVSALVVMPIFVKGASVANAQGYFGNPCMDPFNQFACNQYGYGYGPYGYPVPYQPDMMEFFRMALAMQLLEAMVEEMRIPKNRYRVGEPTSGQLLIKNPSSNDITGEFSVLLKPKNARRVENREDYEIDLEAHEAVLANFEDGPSPETRGNKALVGVTQDNYAGREIISYV